MEGRSEVEVQAAIFKAAVKGEIDEALIAKYEREVYEFRTPGVGNNIVHLAVRHGHLQFIDTAAISLFWELIRQKNNNSNTPLHEAAEMGTKETVQLLISHLRNSGSDTDNDDNLIMSQLFQVNHEGDTPFHVALKSHNLMVVEELFSYVMDRPEILIIKNNVLETPLHIYIRYCDGGYLPARIEHNDIRQTLIYRLIELNYMALFEHDSEGLNPLMSAAEYGRVYHILVVLSTYPQSMDCRDSKGRCFLHHLRLTVNKLDAQNRKQALRICKMILQVPGVDALIFSRDHNGNTPLYRAILEKEFGIAEIILERCVEAHLSTRMSKFITSTRNSEGKTIFDLLTSSTDLPPIIKNLMKQAPKKRRMDQDMYMIGKSLNLYLLQELDEDDYLSQDVDGKNILHIAIQHQLKSFFDWHADDKYTPFIKEAIERCPQLMYQKDCNGNTPLHIAARFSSDAGKILLEESLEYWNGIMKRNNGESADDLELDLTLPPWQVKNWKGHTPIHEAACTYNLIGLERVIEGMNTRDQVEALSGGNEYGENAFHLIATSIKMQDNAEKIPNSDWELATTLSNLADRCKIGGCRRDMDGFTPLLRAAYSGRFTLVWMFSENFPKSTGISDKKGRNVLHHICSSPPLSTSTTTGSSTGVLELHYLITKLWESESVPDMYPGAEELVVAKDEDGNTPLHLAIIHQRFEVAHYLISHYANVNSTFLTHVRETRNKQGKSIIHYLVSCEDLAGSGVVAKLKALLEHVGPAPVMDDKLYEAATNGDLRYIQGIDNALLQSQTRDYDGSSTLHLALLNHDSIMVKHLVRLTEPIYYKDSKGDTPLHLAVTLDNDEDLCFLESCTEHWTERNREDESFSLVFPPPWLVKNSKGNTYRHEAARLCNYNVIFSPRLNEYDIQEVNNQGETVLHVIVKYATNSANEFLENLSKEMQSLIYIQDVEGFTPVLRAMQYGRLGVATNLIKKCPRSIAIPDNKGRSVLHHLRALVVDLVDEVKDILPVWNNFFRIPGVDDLRKAQDEDGNTPLHLAIIYGDFTKTKFLMEKCLQSNNKRELNLVNNDGHSVFDLVLSRDHNPAMKEFKSFVSKHYVKERELMHDVMEDGLYQAAIEGNTGYLNEQCDSSSDDAESRPPRQCQNYLCKQTPGGSNIVHLALCHGQANVAEEFIEKALEKKSVLSMRQDSNGDTPLHLAAKWKTGVSIVELLIQASVNFLGEEDENKRACLYVAPWAVKNYKGSFPIHEALQTSNLDAAYKLLECDEDCVVRVNDFGDTALHSFAQNGFSVGGYEDAERFVSAVLEKSSQAAYVRNDEGLTPLLTAARSGCLQVARAILKCCPQSAYLRDPSGRTFLHLLRFIGEDVDESLAGTFKETGKDLFDIPEANAQRLVQDYNGNTPLHHAIIEQNSIVAIVLTQKCLEDQDQSELQLVNKQGHTIPDILANHDVPNEIIELIHKKVPKAVNLARSSYGIRKTEMKDSANALSVVAGLLATMTFAAAFQMPGGSSDEGFPILWQKPAFTIFSMANTIAMCTSMLCLFLLLWVMGIGKIYGSLKILDISIFLLRISFYLTLLTFTTGVFVATAEKSLWLAIIVCVLVFLTFLLTFKYSIKTIAKYGGHANTAINKVIKLVRSKFSKYPGHVITTGK